MKVILLALPALLLAVLAWRPTNAEASSAYYRVHLGEERPYGALQTEDRAKPLRKSAMLPKSYSRSPPHSVW
jgi:hypothetical protein